MNNVKHLQTRKYNFLLDREREWGLKSWDTWLPLENQNIQYFYNFSKHSKIS